MLDRSERRVLELASQGLIRVQETHNPQTKRRQTVLLEEDVLRIRNSRNGETTAIGGNRRTAALLAAAGEPPKLPPGYFAKPLQLAAPDDDLPERSRPWKSLDEAEDHTGLPRCYLLELIRTGELKARDVKVRKGGRYRIHVRDLDAIGGIAVQVDAGDGGSYSGQIADDADRFISG